MTLIAKITITLAVASAPSRLFQKPRQAQSLSKPKAKEEAKSSRNEWENQITPLYLLLLAAAKTRGSRKKVQRNSYWVIMEMPLHRGTVLNALHSVDNLCPET